MLQLEHISKSYTTGTFTQTALDDVSLAFRDNEFVSILGPSGSGKTTLLNVVGGLDHFDSGDLLIDGISTREYKDRDWDTYRNNRIGFVFQSYNLIPHQTILSNVELALTLSGVSPAERRERARKALEDVGLGDHVDKRPSQLSGGQMQRVAIARALINDSEILLADEPTGALDSHTSVQVMDLLRGVAADRLVIMVTHNPDLAHEYSTRIVELTDGRVCADSNPYVPAASDLRDAKPVRRTSMSFLTALSLSFNNLMTKKGRTLMTAFAGSIGIIGIAAILALANGVNAYIQEVEEDTLSAYPLQILSSGFDMTTMMVDLQGGQDQDTSVSADGEDEQGTEQSQEFAQGSVGEARMIGKMFGSVGRNDLAALKEYLDNNGGGVQDYVQDIEYIYNVVPQIFLEQDGKFQQVNPDTSFTAFGIGNSSSAVISSSSAFSTNVFQELPENLTMLKDQYDVKAGKWPETKNELVVVVSKTGRIMDFVSYAMGLRDHDELAEMVQKITDQEDFEAPTDERTYTYEQLMKPVFKVVPASHMYTYEPDFKVWTSKADDKEYIKQLVGKEGQELHIVGVVQPKEGVDATTITQGVFYTPELTKWLMKEAADSKIVQEQLANPSINVMSGKSFDAEAQERGEDFDMSSLFSIDENKIANAFSMDTSKVDLSGLDLAGLSTLDLTQALGGVSFNDIDLKLDNLDLSGLDFSKVFTPEVINALTPAVRNIDVQALLNGVTPTVDSATVQTVTSQAMAGFGEYFTQEYLVAHPITDPTDPQAMPNAMSAALAEYLANPSVSGQIANGIMGAITFTEADQQRIAQNFQAQVQQNQANLSEGDRNAQTAASQQAIQTIIAQVGPQVSKQLGDQLSQQIGQRMSQALGAYISDALTSAMTRTMAQAMQSMAGAMSIDTQAFAEAFEFNMDQQELSELMMALMSTERTSYDNNLAKLGYADEETPSEIDIYPINFEAKAEVTAILDSYNDKMRTEGDEDKVITYTDIVGALMSSVTDIVNMISAVLIAFVAISLVVSSIMIGVITYISVLERKKEIGILRSIGASKRDISRVFNAETVIEGLVSGIMGVGITALICIPANIIVEKAFDVVRVARLPIGAALILVGVSVFLSFVAGLIPSSKAAKADPVEALRSE